MAYVQEVHQVTFKFLSALLHRGARNCCIMEFVHVILEMVPSNHDSDHNMGTHHCIQIEGCFLPHWMHSSEGAVVGWKISQ